MGEGGHSVELEVYGTKPADDADDAADAACVRTRFMRTIIEPNLTLKATLMYELLHQCALTYSYVHMSTPFIQSLYE